MLAHQANFLRQLGAILILLAVFYLSGAGESLRVLADNQTSKVSLVNATPVISNIVINGNTPITLTANTTTQLQVGFTVSDADGCGDVFFTGGVTSTLYRSSTTLPCTFSYNNCYIVSTSSLTHACPFATSSNLSANATATFSIYYFADATDASSSYPAQDWRAYIEAKDSSSTISTTSSATGVDMNTLIAINPATTTIDYGTVTAGSNTGSTNQNIEVFNVGNSSSSIQVSGTNMTSGGNTINASNQHYATGTFSYGGAEQLLSGVAATVSGWLTNHGPNIRGWSTTTPMLSGVLGSARFPLVTNGKFVYVLGGWVFGTTRTSTVVYASINSTGSLSSWSETTPLNAKKEAHAAVIFDDRIYVSGGFIEAYGHTSTVMYASINSTGSLSSWNNTTPLPSSTSGHVSVVHNRMIYMLGGNNVSDTSSVLYAPINSTGSLGSWLYTTPLPSVLNAHRGFIYDDKIYILGGFDGTNETSSVWYAPINSTGSLGSWFFAGSLPGARYYPGVGLSGNNIYLVAGSDASDTGTSSAYFTPILQDNSIDRWQNLPSLPSPRDDAQQVISRGFLYVVGGRTLGLFPTTTVYLANLNSKPSYWGLAVPSGSATGTYTGTNTFVATFVQ